jgi:hypothetical protein
MQPYLPGLLLISILACGCDQAHPVKNGSSGDSSRRARSEPDRAQPPLPVWTRLDAEAESRPIQLWENCNLPASFQKTLTDRSLLDRMRVLAYGLESDLAPGSRQLTRRPVANPRAFRILHSQPSSAVLNWRRTLAEDAVPRRGYRAAILEDATDFTAPYPPPASDASIKEPDARAAAHVEHHLASEGLLPALAEVMSLLGPAALGSNRAELPSRLRRIGFPVDLVRYFHRPKEPGKAPAPYELLWEIRDRLRWGERLETLQEDLTAVPFRFVKSDPDFQVATECGDEEIGLIRMQMGGGYRNGIIPGGSIDLIDQMILALPEVDVLLSVPEEFFSNARRLALSRWSLPRTNQLALIGEPLPVTPWAQDNGKAGLLRMKGSSELIPATLAPRYACQGEGDSRFMPGESFLAEGWKLAGHEVIHSPLLFQGGNLMAVTDPVRHERVLLVGEAELYRNMALGLSRAQTLEAFREEFEVDRCLVFPGVSFHLDFDVTFRSRPGGLAAFVNDPMTASRIVLRRGLETLLEHQALEPSAAEKAFAYVRAKNDKGLYDWLSPLVGSWLGPGGSFPLSMEKWFAFERLDAPALNVRCFLLALDLVASRAYPEPPPGWPVAYWKYLTALRALDAIAQRQRAILEEQGWKVVPVPSWPDLGLGLNYLNGIQDLTRYLMPAQDGFYRDLDEAAAAAFEQECGEDFTVIPIMTVESQRQYGAVHCATAVYPRVRGQQTRKAGS